MWSLDRAEWRSGRPVRFGILACRIVEGMKIVEFWYQYLFMYPTDSVL